jgi:hypothetical protein
MTRGIVDHRPRRCVGQDEIRRPILVLRLHSTAHEESGFGVL